MKKLIVACIVCSVFSIASAQNNRPKTTAFPYAPSTDNSLPAPVPAVPVYLLFAGDTIRFDTREKIERMDREIINFCYMHSVSTLMYKRSERFFSQVEPVLSQCGLPDDFKYLMVIESNLDPKAVSYAGAAGLWQISKATAKENGLVVDGEVDERFNTYKATEVACKYLLNAFAKYGEWALSAASYNCGTNGVDRRINDQHLRSFFDLWLPEETTRYVYRILAAKMFFTDPASFGFNLKPSDMYPETRVEKYVGVSSEIPSLADFAESQGVSYADLKRANLWLRDSKLLNREGRSYSIAIPKL